MPRPCSSPFRRIGAKAVQDPLRRGIYPDRRLLHRLHRPVHQPNPTRQLNQHEFTGHFQPLPRTAPVPDRGKPVLRPRRTNLRAAHPPAQDLFLAVVGVSGSGKSSPSAPAFCRELHGGTMATAGYLSWEVAVMRPGGDLLTNLAGGPHRDADIHDSYEEHIASHLRATLGRSGKGLVGPSNRATFPSAPTSSSSSTSLRKSSLRRMSKPFGGRGRHFITLLLGQ